MVLIPLVLLIIGLAMWYRRMHLMVNHPDKYERFHEMEQKFARVQVKTTERAAKGLLAALRRLWERLGKRNQRKPHLMEDREWN